MTALATPPRSSAGRYGVRSAALLGGFGAAVALRILLGGPDIAGSAVAGLAFAAALGALTAAAGTRCSLTIRGALSGVAGGCVLCLPALLSRLAGGGTPAPAGNYLRWSLIVMVVAGAEEAFLRGALYDAVAGWAGEPAAVAVAAAGFALLHVPLYGWHVVPLDLAVGCWLGALRAASGSYAVPAVAHAVADLAAWWLR